MYGANVGQMGWLSRPATVNQAVCGLVIDETKAHWRFVFYALQLTRGELVVQAQGAAQQNLNQDLIRQFRLPSPPPAAQRRIAAVLGDYDDLIDNNLRRIQLLEGMARAIYREWFVHFRFPGHEGIAMVDSPLGPIPEGWEVKRLGDALELEYGKALKEADRLDGSVPVFGSSGVVGHHNAALVQGPGLIVGRKGNVGSLHWSDQGFWPIDTVYFVRSRLPLRFLYFDLQGKNFINNDAAVPGLSRRQAYTLEMVVPPAPILESFRSLADVLGECASALSRQVEVLGATRDLLLPRLMSGELTLPEAEKAVPAGL
jgi:type I restriction enzyme S subunit